MHSSLNCLVAEETDIHDQFALIKLGLLARVEGKQWRLTRPTVHFSNPSNLLGGDDGSTPESRNRAFGDKPNSAPIRRMVVHRFATRSASVG
jgi:hypothetical protein